MTLNSPVNRAVRWLTTEKIYPGHVLGNSQASLRGRLEIQPSRLETWGQGVGRVAAQFGLSEGAWQPDRREADDATRWLAALAGLAGALQRHCRIPVNDWYHIEWPAGPSASTAEVRIGRLTVPWVRREATFACIEWLLQTLHAWETTEDDVALEAACQALPSQLQRYSEPGSNRYSILRSAAQLGIPVTALNAEVLVLGHGQRARWMKSTLTDQTPSIGVSLALNKVQTAWVLRQAGLPGAEHQRVDSAEAAVTAAQQLGYPVVIKPADQEQGRGVAADLRTGEAVREAYAAACQVSSHILVERWQAGHTHRLTVFQGQLFRVTQRVAGGVTGDGVHTIAELVVLQQQTEVARRRAAQKAGVPLLSLDAEALGLLAQYQRHPETVPALGEYVRLRRRDNINAGGDNRPLRLEQVHPDNRHLAEDAARLLRLDIAGVDFITPDITRSWRDVGGLICEVNAQPQLGANSHADAYPVMLNALLPQGGRIPLRLVVCLDDEAAHRALATQAATRLGVNGLSSRYGLWVDGAWRTTAFASGFVAALALLKRSDVERAACLMSPSEVLTYGLPTPYVTTFNMLEAASWPAIEQARLEALGPLVQPHRADAAGLRSVTNK